MDKVRWAARVRCDSCSDVRSVARESIVLAVATEAIAVWRFAVVGRFGRIGYLMGLIGRTRREAITT